MKRFFTILLFAGMLLAVGCDQTEQNSFSEAESTASSAESVSSETVSADSFETVSLLESSEEEISLITEETLALMPGVAFRLPNGWFSEERGLSGEVFSASDENGLFSVLAQKTELPDMFGVTEELLVEEMLPELSEGWTSAGAQEVQAEEISVPFLGEAHPAVSLFALYDGKTVYQTQLYLLLDGELLTLTVTSRGEDVRNTLWTYFETESY